MGFCFKSYSPYKFDQPEMIRDGAKMNLAGHRVRRLSAYYFEPCTCYLHFVLCFGTIIICNVGHNNNITPYYHVYVSYYYYFYLHILLHICGLINWKKVL